MKKHIPTFLLITGCLLLSHCHFPPPTTSEDQAQVIVKPDPHLQNIESLKTENADRQSQIRALRDDIDQLKGKLQVLGYEIEQLRLQGNKSDQDFDSRLATLEQYATRIMSMSRASPDQLPNQLMATPSTSSTNYPSARPDTTTMITSQGGVDLWAGKVQAGVDLDASIAGLKAWVEQNPNSNKKQDALFFLALAHFKKGLYAQAIQDFQTVIDAFPRSDQACEARFQQGLSFIKLGDSKSARLFFEETIELCPQHVAKAKSQTEIQKLN